MAVKLAPVIVAVAIPEPVMVTRAVAVAVGVAVAGTYCTTIVQLLPGATTTPEAQVPPVMVNVPPGAPTLAIVGADVKVSGPVAAAALLTVIVPVSVAVLAGVVVSTGAGAEIATVAPVTVNGSVLVVPTGVATPIFLIPKVAPGAITRLAVT